MTSNLIGLVGTAGAGKDTLAGFLAPYGYTRVGFADALKAAAYDADPLIELSPYGSVRRLSYLVDAIGWDDAKREYDDARRFLQRLGVAMRDARPGMWLDIAADKIDDLSRAGKNVVITDVRFPDEAAMIRRRGGLVVRIERPGHNEAGVNSSHPSETNVAAMPADYVVVNDIGVQKLALVARDLHGLFSADDGIADALMRAYR